MREQLIPDLPEELVLAQIVPRLPWYTRPLCRALSKSWRTMLDTRNPELDLRTRTFQLPLLRDRFLFCTFDKQIFIRDLGIHEPCRINTYRIQPHWRKLPPLRGLVVPPPTGATLVASAGMVYVWSDNVLSDRGSASFVLKLDMGRADWTWNVFHVPCAYNFDAVSFDRKIYVPGVSARWSTNSSSQKKVVFVHNMTTDECRPVETWNEENLRVLSKCTHSNFDGGEEMYSFVEEDLDTKLQVFVYDVESDSWRALEDVPIPKFRWSHLQQVKLLSSDCFEPAPEMGINIIWIDHSSELISWYNSSIGMSWVDIGYNPLLDGKYLEYIQFICGSMYGIFCDEREEKEDGAGEKEYNGGGLLEFSRRSIMKGRIIVSESIVVWEEVHEVGFFQESYRVGSSVMQPIDWYTLMA